MSRSVRVATVSLDLPPSPQTIAVNLERAMQAIDHACTQRPDVVCLPEMYVTLGTADYTAAVHRAAAEEAQINARVAERARRWRCYIVSTGPEGAGNHVYNTATIFDRDGGVLGRYRKTHLAPGEEGLFARGDDYPVFNADFGRIAVMICMDIHYPEIPRIYALQGTDLICWPTMSYGPTGEFLEVLFRSRAMDNQVYCMTSNYCQQPYLAGKVMGRAYVVGPDGKIRADTGHRVGVACANVDLDEGYEYWAGRSDLPTLKEAFLGLRRPDTYGVLVTPNEQLRHWRIADPTISQTLRDMMAARDAERAKAPTQANT